jgi:hypothetical protein
LVPRPGVVLRWGHEPRRHARHAHADVSLGVCDGNVRFQHATSGSLQFGKNLVVTANANIEKGGLVLRR